MSGRATSAAYKTYRVKAVFPEIVANLCDEALQGRMREKRP